jgi:hypothetical protein
MREPADNEAMVTKARRKRLGESTRAVGSGAGKRRAVTARAGKREGGLRRASRWFLTGLSVAYVGAILWTSIAHAGAFDGGYIRSADDRGAVGGGSGHGSGRALRVIYSRGLSFGLGSRSASFDSRYAPTGARFSPVGVRSYVQNAARAAGVNPNAAEWIVAHESSHRPGVTGDGGESRGLWQISRIYHPEVSDRCAYDVKCSTAWSLRNILHGNINEWSTWRFREKLAAHN